MYSQKNRKIARKLKHTCLNQDWLCHEDMTRIVLFLSKLHDLEKVLTHTHGVALTTYRVKTPCTMA